MPSSKKASNYYNGTSEEATDTPLTLKRLEPRRKLTKNSQRLVIAMVGLPARGKSFVSRKLEAYLNWSGSQAKIFNVGRYRREAYKSLQQQQQQQSNTTKNGKTRTVTGACDASFFDSNNEEAAQLREHVAKIALEDMLNWLDQDDEEEDSTEEGDNSGSDNNNNNNRNLNADISRHSFMSVSTNYLGTGGAKLDYNDHGRIAIFDATNSTDKRRQWILEECTSPEKRGNKQTGVVFVESLCDDKELLDENYRFKVSNSPDFENMTQEEAMEDLKQRVKKYEDQYETIQDDSISYIKVFNLSSKLLCNHIYGRMAKETVPALMAWHIGTRPVFLCRPGQTISGIFTDGEDYVARDRIDYSDPRFLDLSHRARRKSMRGDKLGPTGEDFRQQLFDYVYDEAHSFLMKRASVHDMASTGTSISGLAASSFSQDAQENKQQSGADENEYREPFPLKILTSTMPRAVDTVSWPEYDFPINQLSNLNPLDKGDFAGMELEEIRELNPEWYEKLERDPYLTRFPGGESYRDLIRRLLSVVIDVEQQVIPTLVVSHVSILQCLIAYFRNTPVERCMSIEVPMHTVIKFTPVRGGGWKESLVPLFDVPPASGAGKEMIPPVESVSEISQSSLNYCEAVPPIWQDGMKGSGFLSKSVE